MVPIKETIPFLPIIRVYSLTFLLSILLVWEGAKHKLFISGKNINNSKLDDFVFILIFIGLLGARLWYVASDLGYYLSNPLKILMVWEGGLAIQGGIIFLIFSAYKIIRRFNIGANIYEIMDAAIPLTLLAQPIGRWGNFYNQEIYGAIVSKSTVSILIYLLTFTQILLALGIIFYNKPWKKIKTATKPFFYKTMIVIGILVLGHAFNLYGLKYIPRMVEHMNINGGYRVPLFLIEGTISIILYIILHFIKTKKPGVKTAYFLIAFGTLRTILEPLRNNLDIMKIGPIYISVLMSLLFIVFGILSIYKIKKGNK